MLCETKKKLITIKKKKKITKGNINNHTKYALFICNKTTKLPCSESRIK